MTSMRRLACVLALLLSVLPCFAQSDSGQISGYVKDSSGAVVVGASVTLVNEATRLERRAQTNETGYFVVANVPPGFYTVTFEAAGFKKFTSTGNKLDANVATSVNATLEVGAVTETVEVVANLAQVQAETATVGKTVDAQQISNLMLNGRNPIWLALLKPGVRSGSSMAGFSFGLTSGGLSINGARTQDMNIAVDGAVAIRTRANGTSIGVGDVETLQEMQILTANYNAEYGRSAGGQIRMVTKSGTSQFHGSFYEYFRNNELDANSWARNRAGLPREARRFNQFGYVLSGPVTIPGKFNTNRNKLFWLWSQEYVRFRRENTSIQTVPSMAMRNGDFSELLNPANTFFGRVRVVNDPTTGMPFANNVIPRSMLSSNGVGFMNAYPEPVPGFLQGTNNFIQTRPQPTNQRKDTISLDYNVNEKHVLRFRHQNYSFTQLDAFRGGFDRAVTDWSRPNKTASLNHIWTISPTTVNEFLVTGSVDRVFIGVDRTGERFARSRYGINYPYIFPERKEIFDKIPTINVSNFATLDGGPYPAFSSGPIYTVSNNTTRVVGNHTVKFGAYFERLGQNDFDQINVTGVPGGTNNQNGRFVFDDTRAGAATSGLALGNAALGLFTTYAEIGPRAYTPYRANMFEMFVQDSWRVNEKLRLELGVRYSLMQPYFYSLWGNMAVFDPSRYDPARAAVVDPRTGNVISGDRYNGVVIPGTGWPDAARGRVAIADTGEFDHLFSGGSRTWGQRQNLNFQPRIGVAYSFDPKTVVRSGFGSFLARPGVSDNIFLGGNPPFQPMVSIANGQADNPGGGTRANFPQFFMTSDPVFKIPRAYNWHAIVQREVQFNTTIEVGYIGRVGTHLERERDLNQLQVGTLQANPGINPAALRPYSGFQFIPMGETAARSTYHALQLEVNRRFSRGFSYGLAYTLSKSMDNASGRRDRPYNAYDDRNFWGKSSFDTRHIAVINFIYEMPFFRDRSAFTGKLLGGWQVSGVTQFQTGVPITVGTPDDFAGIGRTDLQPWSVNGATGLSRGERAFSQGTADQNFWFRTTSGGDPIFTRPAAGTFSNQNRNSLPFHDVGLQNWNLGLFKEFMAGEVHRFQFRAEFFNFPNHPNFSGVTRDPRSGTFGKVTGKTSERNVQLSLRYSF